MQQHVSSFVEEREPEAVVLLVTIAKGDDGSVRTRPEGGAADPAVLDLWNEDNDDARLSAHVDDLVDVVFCGETANVVEHRSESGSGVRLDLRVLCVRLCKTQPRHHSAWVTSVCLRTAER